MTTVKLYEHSFGNGIGVSRIRLETFQQDVPALSEDEMVRTSHLDEADFKILVRAMLEVEEAIDRRVDDAMKKGKMYDAIRAIYPGLSPSQFADSLQANIKAAIQRVYGKEKPE